VSVSHREVQVSVSNQFMQDMLYCTHSGTGKGFSPSASTDEMERKPVKITGAHWCGKGPDHVAYVFGFSVVSLFVDCAN
jgi:hypothetical protein